MDRVLAATQRARLAFVAEESILAAEDTLREVCP